MRPKQKTLPELEEQVKSVTELLGDDIGPAMTAELRRLEKADAEASIYEMSVDEIRNIYGRRYRIYLDVLRQLKNNRLDQTQTEKYRVMIKALNNLDNYFISRMGKMQKGEPVLRDLQMPVLHAIHSFLERDTNAGYVKLPTGTGKTAVFLEMIEAMDMRTIIVVPNNTLVEQLVPVKKSDEDGQKRVTQLEKFAPVLVDDAGVVNKDSKQFSGKVTVITYQSLVLLIKTQRELEEKATRANLPPEKALHGIDLKTWKNIQALRSAGIVILDEAHRCQSFKRREIVEFFDSQIKIGFTATPDFSENKKLEDVLPVRIYEKGIKEAISERQLAPVAFPKDDPNNPGLLVQMDVDLSDVKIISTENGDDYETASLRRAINSVEIREAAISYYVDNYSDERSVFYCIDRKHAKDICDDLANNPVFKRRGHKAAFISGNEVYIAGETATPVNVNTAEGKRLKADIIQRFENGDIRALMNADILIEGFDVPSASVCMNLRPTLSPVVEEQRCGRVLRIDPANPEKIAHIVDFVYRDVKDAKQENQQVTFRQIFNGTFRLMPAEKQQSKKRGGADPQTIEEIEGVNVDVTYDESANMELRRKSTLEKIQKGELVEYKGSDFGNMEKTGNAILLWLKANSENQIVDFEGKTYLPPNFLAIIKRSLTDISLRIRRRDSSGHYGRLQADEKTQQVVPMQLFALPDMNMADSLLEVITAHPEVGFYKTPQGAYQLMGAASVIPQLQTFLESRQKVIEKTRRLEEEIPMLTPEQARTFIPCRLAYAQVGGKARFFELAEKCLKENERLPWGQFRETWNGVFFKFRDQKGNIDYYFDRSNFQNKGIMEILVKVLEDAGKRK